MVMPANAAKMLDRFALALICTLLWQFPLAGAESLPLKVPDGFHLKEAASSALVTFPMFGALDDQGHLFVTESSGGDLYAELSHQNKTSRVTRLTDADGDGIYDKADIFLDGLSPSMGIAWRAGKLYVADPPDLLVLEDTDGDGRADKKTVLLTGFGHTDNGSLHGITFGPDGWLYFTMGNPDSYDLTGPDGSHTKSGTGALIRCKPDGTHLETVALGFENLVEVAWLPDGSIIGTDNWFYLPQEGKRDVLVHLLLGGQYPLHARERGGMPVDFRKYLPHVTVFPAVAESGLMRYDGTAFPPEMRGQLFSAQFNARKVMLHRISNQGSSYTSENIDFITTEDPDVHFSDVLEDRDGTLLAINSGSWYVHHCPTGKIRKTSAKGAIYRVSYGSMRANASSDAPWFSNDPEESLAMLKSGDSVRKAAAARSLGRAGATNAIAPLVELLSQKEAPLRLAAAEALVTCGNSTALPALIKALAEPCDDFLEHALVYAIWRLGDASSLRAALQNPAPRVQRAALLLLEQPPFSNSDERSVSERLFAPDQSVREIARWVLQRHPAWGEAGSAFVLRLLQDANLTDDDQDALRSVLPIFNSNPRVIDLIKSILQKRDVGAEESQVRILETIAANPNRNWPAAWLESAKELLNQGAPKVRLQALGVVSAMRLPGVEKTLEYQSQEANLPAELRMSDLKELNRRGYNLQPQAVAFLQHQLTGKTNGTLRLGAAETLLAANLSGEQWKETLRLLRGDNLLQPMAVVTALQKQKLISTLGIPLLEYLNASLDAGWSLPPESISALEKELRPEDRAAAQTISQRLTETAARQRQQLDDLQPLLHGGDRVKGQGLFYDKAQCSRCHSVYGIGGKIGPDLTKVGAIRAGRDILESIVLPSATIAQGYDQLMVYLKNGDVLSGIRVGKNENNFILRDSAGADTRLVPGEILKVDRSKLSLMPEGLLQTLSASETRDLLAYLQSLK